MKLTEEFFLINKKRNHLKRSPKYEYIAYKENDYIEIDFGYIFRTSTKPIWKGTKIQSMEDGLKEYDEMLNQVWEKTNLYERSFSIKRLN